MTGRRITRLGALLLVALALPGLLGACNPHLTLARAIAGSLILDQRDPVERGGGECRGTGGYADLRSGVVVVVRDESGAELGRSPLRARPAPTNADGTVPEPERRRCVWTFALENLEDRPSYAISIGERGAVTYSRAELEAADWQVQVSLGTQ
jgi:hypothetical protein